MLTYQKSEVYEMLDRIRKNIYAIDNVINGCNLNSDEAEMMDTAKENLFDLVNKIENYIDNVPMP